MYQSKKDRERLIGQNVETNGEIADTAFCIVADDARNFPSYRAWKKCS